MEYSKEKMQQAGEIVQSFVTINKTLTKFTEKNASSLGLTLPQMGILNTVSSSPGITLKEITEKLFLSKSTISINIEELVGKGLMERKTSENDRREINLKTTAAGKQLSVKSSQNALSYRAMASVLDKMSEDEVRWLIHIHKEILTWLKESGQRTEDLLPD